MLIESCLSQTAIIAVDSTIPGVGQEPFAIFAEYKDKSAEEIKQYVIDLFGKDYQLAGAASLQQLGLDTFPLNPTGKVQKIDLEAAYKRYQAAKS